MQFTTTCGDLREALNAARAACSPSAPVLAHTGVRLRVSGGGVDVCGSDSDVSILAAVSAADDTEDGESVVAPAPLAALLDASAAEEPVRLSVDGGDVVVAVGELQPYKLRSLAVQFPQPLTVSGAQNPIDGGLLGEALAVVKPASGSVIPGVAIRSSGESLRIAATDGYRLHVAGVHGSGFGEFEGVVPLAVLDRAVRGKSTHVAVEPTGRLISFSGKRVSVTARLMHTTAPYPSIDGMLAAQSPVRFSVPKAEWVAALTRLAAVGSDVPVVLSVAGGKLTLAAQQTEVGAGSEAIGIEVLAGDPSALDFAGDRGFLASAGAVHGANLELGWRAGDKPMLIESRASVDVTTVISPVLFS